MSGGTAMKRESIEALRARFLADKQVHSMIEMRAYEIYAIRGGAPGREAEDWIQAEAEILKFLIEEETRRNETEALVGQSTAREFTDPSAPPLKPGPEPAETPLSGFEEAGRPSSQEAETIELASPLGLADFLTDRIAGIEPNAAPVEDQATKVHRTRSRGTAKKPPVAGKEAGKKPALAKASTKKAGEKKSGEKKSSKKPKKS